MIWKFYQFFIILSTVFEKPIKTFRKAVEIRIRNVYNGSMKGAKRMVEGIEGFCLPRYAQIPDVGLYLEQVVCATPTPALHRWESRG